MEATVGAMDKGPEWERTWYIGKTERQPMSTKPSVLGHVVKIRLERLTGDGGRCLLSHNKEPEFFGLNFYLEIISKLQKSE